MGIYGTLDDGEGKVMNGLSAIFLVLTFSFFAFFAGVNYERTGCAAIAKMLGCVPHEATQ